MGTSVSHLHKQNDNLTAVMKSSIALIALCAIMSAAADEPISAIDRQSTMPPLNLVQQGAWCRENRPDMNGLQCTLTGMFYADCCQTFMQWFPAMGVTCVVDQNLCATIYHLLNNVIVPLAVN